MSSKTRIDNIFREGKSFSVFPLKVVYTQHIGIQTKLPEILISVPKRKFKLAVTRNLLKRRIREAYRLSKMNLNIRPEGPNLNIAIIYIGSEIRSFNEILNNINLLLQKLNKRL